MLADGVSSHAQAHFVLRCVRVMDLFRVLPVSGGTSLRSSSRGRGGTSSSSRSVSSLASVGRRLGEPLTATDWTS